MHTVSKDNVGINCLPSGLPMFMTTPAPDTLFAGIRKFRYGETDEEDQVGIVDVTTLFAEKGFEDLPDLFHLLGIALGKAAGTEPKRILHADADIATHRGRLGRVGVGGGARPQLDDAVRALAIGHDGADLLDERGAACFNRDTRQRGAGHPDGAGHRGDQ